MCFISHVSALAVVHMSHMQQPATPNKSMPMWMTQGTHQQEEQQQQQQGVIGLFYFGYGQTRTMQKAASGAAVATSIPGDIQSSGSCSTGSVHPDEHCLALLCTLVSTIIHAQLMTTMYTCRVHNRSLLLAAACHVCAHACTSFALLHDLWSLITKTSLTDAWHSLQESVYNTAIFRSQLEGLPELKHLQREFFC